jgi:dihydroorotase-like cyclic amidohydrolase
MATERAVELVSANPAKYFGLYPRKGAIAIGSDADLAIVDMETKKPVTVDSLHSAQDFSPFEGQSFAGWPVVTMLRGQVVFKDGATQGQPGGQFLRRA